MLNGYWIARTAGSSSVTLSERSYDEKACLIQATRLKTFDSQVLEGAAQWGEEPPTSSAPESTMPGLAKLVLSDKRNLATSL